MELHLPFGKSSLNLQVPDAVRVDILEAPQTPAASDPVETVRSALENLLGGLVWDDFAGAQSVAIAINDKTRPVPHAQLLPPLLERLSALGIPDQAIVFYIAVGTHPPMRTDEFGAVLPPEIISRYQVISHDSEDPGMFYPVCSIF